MIYISESTRILNNSINNINENKIIESFYTPITAYNVLNEANFINNFIEMIKTAAKKFWELIKRKWEALCRFLNEKIFSKIKSNIIKRRKSIASDNYIKNNMSKSKILITVDKDKLPKILTSGNDYIKNAFESINLNRIREDMTDDEYKEYLNDMLYKFIKDLLPGIDISSNADYDELMKAVDKYFDDIKITDENGNIKEKYVKVIMVRDESDIEKGRKQIEAFNNYLDIIVNKQVTREKLVKDEFKKLQDRAEKIFEQMILNKLNSEKFKEDLEKSKEELEKSKNESLNNIKNRHEDFLKIMNKSENLEQEANKRSAKALGELDKLFVDDNKDNEDNKDIAELTKNVNELKDDKDNNKNKPKNESVDIFSTIKFI